MTGYTNPLGRSTHLVAHSSVTKVQVSQATRISENVKMWMLRKWKSHTLGLGFFGSFYDGRSSNDLKKKATERINYPKKKNQFASLILKNNKLRLAIQRKNK